ncbi:lysophospholipase [Arthrobacter sp. MYb222]|uniref:lysophospholipase n=1 Tax=Arthrobacter sp. MYb222 TaxID=1848599 RepID=UPI0011B02A45|nr:lysophospholipase [Arthrobacter sp. MYb222]
MAIRNKDHTSRIYENVTEFITKGLPETGKSTIMAGRVPIDIDFEYHGFSTTLVVFHAALSSKAKSLPMFAGRRLASQLPVNRLSISDPTLTLNDNLRLAWFAGSEKQPGLQSAISKIVRHATNRDEKIIYFGSSGGGFAALQYAARHPGSIAVPINPQTDIARYNPVSVAKWVTSAWPNLDSKNGRILPPVYTDVSKQYCRQRDAKVFYIQNTGDISHVRNHQKPFLRRIHSQNFCKMIDVNVGKGHVPPSPSFLLNILERIIVNDEMESISFADLVIVEEAKHSTTS